MKRIYSKVAFGALGLLGLLVVLAAAFYGWVQSEPGRAWLAGRIAHLASAEGEREVTIGRLTGNIFRRIHLQDVSVKDPSNAWLEIRSIDIFWSPGQLLHGIIHLRELRLSGFRIDRLPATTDEGGDRLSGLQSLGRLPLLSVSNLDVEDLSLGASVLGTEAVLQIKGTVESGPENTVKGTLSVQRSDGPMGKVRLTATYRPADGILGIDLDIAEAAGGLVARTLGVPALPALQGSLKGDGPLSAWRARSAITFDGAASVSADIAVQSGADLKFQLTGNANVAPQQSGPSSLLWSGSHRYRVSGRYDAEGILEVDAAEWEGEVLQMEVNGRMDTDDLAIDARGTVRSREGRRLPIGPDRTEVGQLTLQARFTRTLIAPDLALSFEAKRLTAPSVTLAGLSGQVTFRSTGIRDGGVRVGEFTGSGSITAIDIAARPQLQAILGRPIEWNAEGSVDVEQSVIRVRSLSLASQLAKISGTGSFAMIKGTGAATLGLRIADLRPLGSAFGQPVVGWADLSLDGTIGAFGDAVDAKLSGKISGLDPAHPVARKLVAGEARLGGGLSLKSGEIVLSDVSASTDAASVHIDGRIPLAGAEIQARYRAQVSEGISLAPAGDVEMFCRCVVTGEVTGQMSDPRLSGKVAVRALGIQQFRLDAVSSSYDMQRLASAPNVQIHADARTEIGPVSLRTDVRLVEDILRLSTIRFGGADATLDGKLAIPIDGTPLTGNLRLAVAKLHPWLRLAGVAGDGEGTARLELAANGGRQRAELTVEVSNARIGADAGDEGVRVKHVTARVTSHDLFAAQQFSTKIEVSEAAAGTARFKRISLSATGSPARADIDVASTGRWIDPFSAEASLVFVRKGSRYDVTMKKMSGRALERQIAIGQPVRILWDRNSFSVDQFALSLGDARAVAAAKLTGDSFDGSVALTNWPLEIVDRLWSSGLAGTLNGTAALKGPRANPSGTIVAEVSKLRLASEPNNTALGLAVSGRWHRGRLLVEGRLSDPTLPPATVNIDLPLRLTPDQVGLVLPQNEPISATAKWSGDTATIWKFLPFPWHQLVGPGRMDAQLSGTLAHPKLQGRLAIQNGTYESLQLGTVLKPVNVTIEFDETKVRVAQFTANDGNSGKMTATGFLTLDPALRYPFEFGVTLETFGVARRDDAEVSASGKIDAKGAMDAARISGRLTIDNAELRVLNTLPPDVVDLEVVEEGRLDDDARPELKVRQPQFDPALDIMIEMPRKVFVRGRGIDSEWKGSLAVTGTLLHPLVGGEISVVRGQISLVGKVFKVKQGSIVLPDRKGAEPEISLTATHRARTFTAEAKAEGPISKPVITLSSSPEMPQDEIVSQILFSKNSTRLSGAEAAQLGIALAQLSGADGGAGNVMDLARETLGIDVLRIETTATSKGEQSSVGAGKYVTDEVYIGVNQGATPESGSVGVDVEVTPNIVLESDVYQSGASNFGFKLKLDY